jgi:hypothetical protein
MTFNELLRTARNMGQLTAEDKATGVKVVLKRSQYGHHDGYRVEVFVHGAKTTERAARRLQDGAQ